MFQFTAFLYNRRMFKLFRYELFRLFGSWRRREPVTPETLRQILCNTRATMQENLDSYRFSSGPFSGVYFKGVFKSVVSGFHAPRAHPVNPDHLPDCPAYSFALGKCVCGGGYDLSSLEDFPEVGKEERIFKTGEGRYHLEAHTFDRHAEAEQAGHAAGCGVDSWEGRCTRKERVEPGEMLSLEQWLAKNYLEDPEL